MNAWRSPRTWAALGLLVAAYFLTDSVELTLYYPLVRAFHLHANPPQMLERASYLCMMLVRLFWNCGLWLGVCITLGHRPNGFPLREKIPGRKLGLGLATGLTVMLGVMLGIWATGSATVLLSGQAPLPALGNGCLWLFLDFLGALGEEIYGRATVLIVAERFLSWRGAVFVSAVMFSGLHLSNPGATWIWLLRLFLQGALLAYATFHTRSLWWPVGYHTGWNWISAPLFGAVGSGYMDEGHILKFIPHGSIWITGGSAGPEGSIFAFAAVLAAFGLLLRMKFNDLTTPAN